MAMGRFGLRELVGEAVRSVSIRPVRLGMTMAGTILGIGALVITVGLAQTGGNQVQQQFDAVSITQVQVTAATGTSGGQQVSLGQLPWDSPQRIAGLAGVLHSALTATITGTHTVTAVNVYDPSDAPQAPIPLMASTPDLLGSVRGILTTGRCFDSGHDSRADKVVLLGGNAAKRLHITDVATLPSIFIDGYAYQVIGILSDVKRVESLLDSVIMPMSTARQRFGVTAPSELDIHIAQGASPVVAHQVPIALNPQDPRALSVFAPVLSDSTRHNVTSDLNVIFLLLGLIALVGGGLGIANVTLLSVIERIGEIGLRRALGATRTMISGQFLAESGLVGLLGGMIGASSGVVAVVAVCAIQSWTPTLDLRLVAGGIALGAVIGLLAGAYPAIKASRIEPIDALRSIG